MNRAAKRAPTTAELARQFVQGVYRSTRDSRAQFIWLKYNSSQELILQVARSMPATLRFHIFGRPQPKTYPELFRRTQNYTGSVAMELKWTITALRYYSSELREFFRVRADFDRFLLLGDYASARSKLLAVENAHGVSLWSLSNRFLLEDLSAGLDANTRHLSEFNSTADLHAFTKILATFLSMRAEKNLSHENFQRKLTRYLAHFDTVPGVRKFFAEILGEDTARFGTGDYASTLFYLTDSSVIDRAFQLILYLVSTACRRSEQSLSRDDLVSLKRSLPVDEIRNLTLVAGFEGITERTEFDERMMDVLDFYTAGRYSESAELAGTLLREKPGVFQLHEVLAKSLIFANREFTSPFPLQSQAHQILSDVDSVYRKAAGYSEALDRLSRAAEIFHYMPLAAGCRYLAASELRPGEADRWHNHHLLSSQFVNPKLAELPTSHQGRLQAIERVHAAFSDSLTVSFMRSVVELSDTAAPITFPNEVSEARRAFYTASLLLKRGEFDTALPLLERLYEGRLDGRRNDYPLYDEITAALYGAYLNSDEISRALTIYVDNYLRDPLIIRGLDTQTLGRKLEAAPTPELARDIDVPIFYSATITNPQDLYVVYDNFLSGHGFQSPRDFIRQSDCYDPRRVASFLHRVCTQKVMAGSIHFTGTDALEDERMLICQHLCRIDSDNQSEYSKEIDEITQLAFIRRGIQKVEEGKIYVDERGIRRTGDKLLRESFRRYRDLSAARGAGELRLLDTTSVGDIAAVQPGQSTQVMNVRELEAEGIRVVFTSHYALFKELFLDIRDRFISSSEYGLDSYLSVRIRHGTLEGQIRSRFEALHLITQRDVHTGTYQINEYWNKALSDCNEAEKQRVQTLLADLSRDVDETARRMKDEVVQVRTELRPTQGLLDFRFEDNILLDLFVAEFEHISAYEEFVDRVFALLWSRLTASLESLRAFMMEDLKDSFVQRLTQLQGDLRSSLRRGKAADLQGNITNCLTAIQNECDRIGRWFTLTGAKYDTDVTLRQIIDVCVASVNNVNPEAEFAPSIEVSEDRSLSGQYFFSFFDIIRTLLDNALRHAGSGVHPDVTITGSVGSEAIHITMRNAISGTVRASDPVKLLDGRIHTIRERGVSEDIRREGGTGYAKILKILQFDLGRRDISIRFAYPNDSQFEVQIQLETGGLLSCESC